MGKQKEKAMRDVRQQQSPGETITGEDIAYETTQDEDGSCSSTVSISFLQKQYTGESQASKKLAESSAAEAAMAGMSFLIKKHMAKYAEAKKEKNKAALDKLKERLAEKKAAEGEPPKKKPKSSK